MHAPRDDMVLEQALRHPNTACHVLLVNIVVVVEEVHVLLVLRGVTILERQYQAVLPALVVVIVAREQRPVLLVKLVNITLLLRKHHVPHVHLGRVNFEEENQVVIFAGI